MNIVLEKQRLVDCFKYLNKVAPRSKNSKTMAYKNVQFVFKNNELSFIAFDGEYFVIVKYGAVPCEDTRVLVEYDTTVKLINLVSSNDLKFSIDESKVKIIDNKNKYSLQIFKGSDFYYLYEEISIPSDPVLTISSDDMCKAVGFVNPCIAADTTQAALRGVYFDGSFLTTDTSSVAYYPFEVPTDNPFFMAKDAANILANLPEKTDIKIYNIKNGIVVVTERAIFLLPVLASNFPKYESILSKINNYGLFARIDTDTLLKACNRMLLFTDPFLKKSAVFKMNDMGITIESSSETKEAVENIPYIESKLEGEISFSMDIKRLVDYLSGSNSTSILFKFSKEIGPGFPLNIKCDGGAQYIEGVIKLKTN